MQSFKMLRFVMYVLICFLIAFFYLIYSYSKYFNNRPESCVQYIVHEGNSNLPIVRIFGIQSNETILDIVKGTFRGVGYRVVDSSDDWDVLWSYTYPFYTLKKELLHIRPHQKINHFPGSGFITQKHNLALLSVDKAPKSFLLPSDKEAFIEYSGRKKDAFWMIKSSHHRGIRILNGSEDLDMPGTFVQEFVKSPLLISGKKFDIGVYVMLTSIDPLRVYIYSGDVLLRFCKKNYQPLNINNVESYVVGDDYLPVWEVPDLKFYFSHLNQTAKESLNAFLYSKGRSSQPLWSQISEIIREVYLRAEESMRSSSPLSRLRNFFELVRFDFIADEYLNVHLLEVNMSPNLSPAHFPANALLYRQVVFDTLRVAGLARKFQGECEISEKDIQVSWEQCASDACQRSCASHKCKICSQCASPEMKECFRAAHLEFANRGRYRRIIPTTGSVSKGHLSEANSLMAAWFRGKCLQDPSWCL